MPRTRERVLPKVGSSIATPMASAWITDFLNAAYYARSAVERDVHDLRLAHGILTTYWSRLPAGQRIGGRDLAAFHRAYARRRFASGRLEHEQLLDGAAQLLGDWFRAAWADPERRAHGIAFETISAREAFDPATRNHARPGRLTPPREPLGRQEVTTYPPVPIPSAEAALEFLSDPARWPDIASAGGRFTALRRGGLEGQTFEIELNVSPAARLPTFIRSYVTCTAVVRAGPSLDEVLDPLVACQPTITDGGDVVAMVQLTTHHRHPLGAAQSRLVIAEASTGTTIRDIGAWDPLPPALAQAYRLGGHEAQVAFWSPSPAASSMLAQLASILTAGDDTEAR